MGLDMYLTKKTYIGNKWRTGAQLIKVIVPNEKDQKGTIPVKSINSERISEITEEFGYWRKANAIHNWFVENVQKGVDECQESYVDTEQLKNLLAIVNEVLENPSKAEQLLPTTKGFFFGSQEYDEYSFQDLRDTKAIIEKALAENDGTFYYQSSW
jgi:hypothetical protein